jgi:TonB family protein
MLRLRTGVLAARAAALLVIGATACATHRTEPVAGLDETPQRLWSPPLVYPQPLLLAQVEGAVTLQALVDTSGRIDPASVRVLRSTNRGFDTAAIEMLLGTRFRPAYREGAPAVAVIEVPVRFELASAVRDSVAAAAAAAEGERLARAGAIGPATEAFTEAQQLDARLMSSATIWWTLCWYGSLWGYPDDVIGTCDRLVTLDPGGARARDARGVARALTGDFRGAIADFEAVIAASSNASQCAERADWIQVLRAGRNPLTPEVVERLRSRGP